MSEYGRMRGWESLTYATGCLCFGAILQTVRDGLDDADLRGRRARGARVEHAGASRPAEPARRARSARRGRGGVPRGAALLGVPRRRAARVDRVQRRVELHLAADRRPGRRRVVDRVRNRARRADRAADDAELRPDCSGASGCDACTCSGAAVYALGFVLWGSVSDPTILSMLTMLEGVAFSLLFTTGVVIVGRLLPSNLYSTGQRGDGHGRVRDRADHRRRHRGVRLRTDGARASCTARRRRWRWQPRSWHGSR